MKRKYYVIILLAIIILTLILILALNKNNQVNDHSPYVEFSLDKKEILEGDSEQLPMKKVNINKNITFISSNPEVVVINEVGIVKALKPGTAIITLIYEDEKNRISDSIEITVKSKYDVSLISVNYELIKGVNDWNKDNVVVKTIINNGNENVGIDLVKYSINCPGVNCDSNILKDNYEFVIDKEGKNNILIEVVDAKGTVVSKSLEVLIDRSKPTINYNLAAGTFYENKSVTINVADSLSGIKSFDINVYKNGVKDGSLSKSNISSSSYSINLNKDATWKVETVVTDKVGNISKDTKSYVIDVMGYREGPGGARYKKTITYKARTYIIYDQHKYADIKFWGDGNLSDNGCGPTSLAIALSGYDASITPITTANIMKRGTFERIQYALKQLGYSDEGIIYYNSNYPDQEKFQSILKQVRAHLAKGYPLIALVTHYSENDSRYKSCGGAHKYATTNHFMAILGEKENGELIIGNSSSGSQTGTLEEIVRCYLGGGKKGFLKINPIKR